MAKTDRARSRFYPRDLAEHFSKAHFPHASHRHAHAEKVLVYTTKRVLTTDAGTPFYFPFSGEIKWVSASVSAAPSGAALKIDILADGVTILDGSNYVEVPDGLKWGYRITPDTRSIVGTEVGSNTPTPLTVQVNTISSATGPATVYFGVVPRIQ